MAKPHDRHSKVAKRDSSFGIEYVTHLNVELISYLDFEYTLDPHDRKIPFNMHSV